MIFHCARTNLDGQYKQMIRPVWSSRRLSVFICLFITPIFCLFPIFSSHSFFHIFLSLLHCLFLSLLQSYLSSVSVQMFLLFSLYHLLVEKALRQVVLIYFLKPSLSFHCYPFQVFWPTNQGRNTWKSLMFKICKPWE